MLWNKQFYDYDVASWLNEHGADVTHGDGHPPRNGEWPHMVSNDIISMPDKWEYPWYAAWDLAFHSIPLGLVDPDFAKPSCCCCCASTTSTRTARCPPTSGTSAT